MSQELLVKTAYKVILEKIIDSAILENISGDTYISHSELRNVLGSKCRIPHNKQVLIIQELYQEGIINRSKSPGRSMAKGEYFYIIKKTTIDMVKNT